MYIGFIRHGETDWSRVGKLQGREDIPLNEHGRQQIHDLAQALQGGPWQSLYCSPLGRTRESADILAAELQLPRPQSLDALVERDFGQASGLTTQERQQHFPDLIYPQMESNAAVQDRVRLAIHTISRQPLCWPAAEGRSETEDSSQRAEAEVCPPRYILVVTHGGWLHELSNLYDPGYAQQWRQVRLKLAGFSLAELTEDQLNFLCFNQSAAELNDGGWFQPWVRAQA
ncbi:histidine phosphatase family protein [Oscillospiraceae bacterium HV4-5-C5C]|nr:histidine phosphatase family protein [Oscillospiraceae bacterium HV4-5-C5C]